MKIIKHMLGNDTEAYIEDRFTKGINIISSDDNNKGKTILIQSLMYALGNEPIFPASFPYKNYYHIAYIETEHDTVVKICRKNNSFAILYKGNLYAFEQESEFKYFINKNIFPLPRILKEYATKLVDLVLYYQIFFIGQDSRNSSNISNNGYYNKNDFINMLYSIKDIGEIHDHQNEREFKLKIKSLENEKKDLLAQNKIMKSKSNTLKTMSIFKDKQAFDAKITEVNLVKKAISDLNKHRNRTVNRRVKNEIVLSELNSLNRTLEQGKIVCLNCQSERIGYSMGEKSSTFDISSVDIRRQILNSIKDRIEAYNEEIDKLTNDINLEQLKLQELLVEEEITLESLLILKSEFIDTVEIDKRLSDIENEITKAKSSLQLKIDNKNDIKTQQKNLLSQLYGEMNKFYKIIDPVGNMEFKSLFTTKKAIYSGSEETEFYLSKLFAFREILNHKFPIIIDHFRARELSTQKEKNALGIIQQFGNQSILTVTLKEEERNKYKHWDNINNIDYSVNESCKLLNSKYRKEFVNALEEFSIIMNYDEV